MRTKQLEDLGYRTFKTVAERDNYRGVEFENLRAVVYADPTPANNAVYRLNGSLNWETDASSSAAIFDDNYDYAIWNADSVGGASRRALSEKFDEIDTVLELLAPEKPNNLSAASLSISQTTYSGFITGTASSASRILRNDVTDVTFNTSNGGEVIYDATAGTLDFNITNAGFNGESAQITFSAADDTGANDTSIPNGYAEINVTEDEDAYLGQAGSAGFWYGFEASGNVNILGNGFVDGTVYNVQMVHSDTGTSATDFKLEDTVTPVVSLTLGTLPATTGSNVKALSGVPSYTTVAPFTFDYTANNIAKSFYKSSNVQFSSTSNKFTITAATTTEQNDVVSLATKNMVINGSQSFNNGTSISVTGTVTDVLNQSANDSVDFTTLYWDLDTESVRRRFSGATATDTVSATAFQDSVRDNDTGGTNAWDTFVTVDELQLLNGVYEYPSNNYTGFTPAGPDYSVLTGDRFATYVTSYSISNTDKFTLNTSGFTGKLAADFGATDNTGSPAAEPNTRILVSVDGGTTWYDATLGAGISNTTLGITGCLESNGGTSTNGVRKIQLPGIASGAVSVRFVFDENSTQSVSEPTAAAY